MATDDHLDNEVSVALRLDEAGFGATAKSRTLSALDRLCGGAIEWLSLPLEERNKKRRDRIEAESSMYKSAAILAAAQAGIDENVADRALRLEFRSIFRKQDNKHNVAQEAIEDLRASPPPQTVMRRTLHLNWTQPFLIASRDTQKALQPKNFGKDGAAFSPPKFDALGRLPLRSFESSTRSTQRQRRYLDHSARTALEMSYLASWLANYLSDKKIF